MERPLRFRKKDTTPLGQAQAPATHLQSGDNSSVTPTRNVQKPSRELLWNSVTSVSSGWSAHAPTLASLPDLVDCPQSDSVTTMHTPCAPPVPPRYEGRDAEGSDIAATTPSNASIVPLKLGEMLRQEASDLWAKAYDEFSAEYKQDLGSVDNIDSDKPEKLKVLKNLLEDAMKAKKENMAS